MGVLKLVTEPEPFFFQISEAREHLVDDTLKIVGLECDVSSEASMEKAFIRTIETFGRVDVVVASAGEFPSLPLLAKLTHQGIQGLSKITLRSSELPSYVLICLLVVSSHPAIHLIASSVCMTSTSTVLSSLHVKPRST